MGTVLQALAVRVVLLSNTPRARQAPRRLAVKQWMHVHGDIMCYYAWKHRAQACVHYSERHGGGTPGTRAATAVGRLHMPSSVG